MPNVLLRFKKDVWTTGRCDGWDTCPSRKDESCYHGKDMPPGFLESDEPVECKRGMFVRTGKRMECIGDTDRQVPVHYYVMVLEKGYP